MSASFPIFFVNPNIPAWANSNSNNIFKVTTWTFCSSLKHCKWFHHIIQILRLFDQRTKAKISSEWCQRKTLNSLTQQLNILKICRNLHMHNHTSVSTNDQTKTYSVSTFLNSKFFCCALQKKKTNKSRNTIKTSLTISSAPTRQQTTRCR